MEIIFICPKCKGQELIEYVPGVFDLVCYDEPRFPGNTVYMCPECGEITRVSGGIVVKVVHPRVTFPITVKTDDYEMTFRMKSVDGVSKTYDISRLEEVTRRFVEDGCIPD